MNRGLKQPASAAHAESAARLGELAKQLGGAVSPGEELAARQRFLVSFGRPRYRWATVAWATAACVGLVAIGLVLVLGQRPAPLEYGVSGALVARDDWLSVPEDRGAARLRFSEGTEIELGPGSKGKVTEVTSVGARVVLERGALHARVVHRPRASWAVVAGPYRIQVTGTAFDVGWSAAAERLEVKLHDGSVVVSGPSIPDGIRVTAGQRLVAHAQSGSAELSSLFQPESDRGAADPPEPAAATPEPPPVESEPAAEPVRAAPAKPPPSWSELVSVGNFRAVLDAAKGRGVETTLANASLRDLVAFSDAARYGGDRRLAQRGLMAQRSRFASSAEARTAAFVLGRLADDRGALGEARRWYDTYLGEAPRGAFAAEAVGRKLVILVRQRDPGARRAAQNYLKRYPRGAHSSYAQEVLRDP